MSRNYIFGANFIKQLKSDQLERTEVVKNFTLNGTTCPF